MNVRTLPAAAFAAAFLCSAFASCQQQNEDPIEYSFVVAGDCRVDQADTNYAANPAGINLAQFDRLFADIATLHPKPVYVFFNGDEIFGYESDTAKLRKAFETWRARVEASPTGKAGIKVVAIPGNHETDVDNGTDKIASADNERVWLSAMGPMIAGYNGPREGGSDSLKTDQSHFTYSLDYRDSHIILMNTDPAGQDSKVPTHWISEDIANARKAGAKHIFAIGHKPAFNYDGSMSMAGGNRTDLWAALEANHAEAMIGSHAHLYARFQPHHAHTWMIVSGNGGSPLETDLPQNKRYFGYVVISVLKSGRVIEKSYGHDVPREGYTAAASEAMYPTTLRDSVDITWKD